MGVAILLRRERSPVPQELTGPVKVRSGYRRDAVEKRAMPEALSPGWITSVDHACTRWLKQRGIVVKQWKERQPEQADKDQQV
jgi:hypothetical protein